MRGISRHDAAHHIAKDITHSWSAEMGADRAIGKESVPDVLQASAKLTGVLASPFMCAGHALCLSRLALPLILMLYECVAQDAGSNPAQVIMPMRGFRPW